MNDTISVLSTRQYVPAAAVMAPSSPWDDVVTEPSEGVVHLTSHFLDRLATLLERLHSFAALPDDWDGEGAVSPSAIAIEKARPIVVDFVRAYLLPSVMPLSDGGVLIEIELGDAASQIEVLPTAAVEYNISVGAEVKQSGAYTLSAKAILRAVAEMRQSGAA